jgi:anti-sigma regulatory factor (Ser/Thr protein kinase)
MAEDVSGGSDRRRDVPLEVLLRIPPAVDAPMRARAEVGALDLPRPAHDDVVLLVSELVTNCVVHADLDPGQEIDLRLLRRPRLVRVEVRDGGRGFADTLIDGEPLSGFGLYLVEQLTDRWGVERDESTCVWFEVDLDDD